MITIPELDELTITIVVDNTTDTLSSIAPGVPQVPEIAYLLGRTPPTGQHDGHDCVVVFDHLCVACHGFSALATARRGDRSTTVLFDVGPYGDVWLANAERLGVDLAAIDVLFLGILLTGFGSAYYHLEPNDQTLFWDRLPMAISFDDIQPPPMLPMSEIR